MNYTDNILKTTYKTVDGRMVIDYGSVIIEGIEHRINNGWVYCDLSLQSRSFNTTLKKGICPKCFQNIKTIAKNNNVNNQLKLF